MCNTPASFIADSGLCVSEMGQPDSYYSQRLGVDESDQMPVSLGYFCFLFLYLLKLGIGTASFQLNHVSDTHICLSIGVKQFNNSPF